MVRQVLAGDYAMYLYYTVAINLPEYKKCLIDDTKFELNTIDIAFTFAKESPYKHMFDEAMSKMKENGEMQRIFMKHSEKNRKCEENDEVKSLGIGNILVVFIFLGCGICFSIISFMVEVIAKKIIMQ